MYRNTQTNLITDFKRFFLIFSILLFLTISFAYSQKNQKWDRAMYQSVKLTDFRKNPLFKQKVDFKNPDSPLLNACLFYLTNEQRVKKKLKELEYAPELEISSWNHSLMMTEKSFFGHTNPKDQSRSSADNRAKLAGIANPYIAENIAQQRGRSGSFTYLKLGEIFIDQWMSSPGHKSNILSENALQLGCGVFFKEENWSATQCFQWFKKIQPQSRKDQLPGN